MRTKSGSDQVELVLVGTYRNGSFLSGLVTHTDYLVNLMANRPAMGNLFVRPREEGRALELATQIDELFKTQAMATRSAPISDFRQQAMRSVSTIRVITQGILAATESAMLPAHTILYGGAVVLASALATSLLPCWELARLPVADALRRL
jgi:hypothetical protein